VQKSGKNTFKNRSKLKEKKPSDEDEEFGEEVDIGTCRTILVEKDQIVTDKP
jgi:hypothetical protein